MLQNGQASAIVAAPSPLFQLNLPVVNFRQLHDVAESVWSPGDLIQSLTEDNGVFLFSYSPRLKTLVSWSGNAEEVLGVKDISIARDANLFLRHVHDDDRFLLLSDLEKALNGKADYRATYRWIRPDTNETRWIHCRARLVEREDDRYFEGFMTDLTNEMTGLVATLAGPDAVASVLDAFPAMVFTLDRDLRIVRMNRAKSIHGFHFGDPDFQESDFKIGRRFANCFSSPEAGANLIESLEAILKGSLSGHQSRIAVDDTVFNLQIMPIVEATGISGLLGIVTDVTDLVRLERQMFNVQRTEGLRLLAAGVTHNFNNALQTILGQATAINSHSENLEVVKSASEAIISSVHRASDLTRQLMTFDDTHRHAMTKVDVNIAAMSAANKIESLFSSGVKVAVVFGSVMQVSAVQEKLIDIVEGLIRNSLESMAGQKSGLLSIKTYQVVLTEQQIGDLQSGHYAKISISDSGPGMSPAIQHRCMDPFFTTKERDHTTGVGLKSSGLGLSSAFAFARELGGTLTIESVKGRGTTVSLYLPLNPSEEGQIANDLFKISPTSDPEVLIVDDDVMVLETARGILTEAGHSCVVAEDYSRATSIVKNFKQSLRVVLIDALMPGMDGATLLRRLKRISPGLVIIGFSGAPPALTRSLLEAGAAQVLKKPVEPRVLKAAIKHALQPREAA